jgi:hypothetical protein
MATSAKSVIESGITAGKSTKFILGQVAKKCPDSKADETHVRFYANKMVRAETLTAEDAAEKYGCGKRGRKAPEATTKAVKTAKTAKTVKTAKTAKTAKVAKTADEAVAKTSSKKVGTKKVISKKSRASKK